jgi:hypothetical protein
MRDKVIYFLFTDDTDTTTSLADLRIAIANAAPSTCSESFRSLLIALYRATAVCGEKIAVLPRASTAFRTCRTLRNTSTAAAAKPRV